MTAIKKTLIVFSIAASVAVLLVLMLNHDWIPFPAGQDMLTVSQEEIGILSRNQFLCIFYFAMYVIVAALFIVHIWQEEYAVRWLLLMAHALLGMAGCLGGMGLAGTGGNFLRMIANSYYALSAVPLFLYAALMFQSFRNVFVPLVLMYCMCSSIYLLFEAVSIDMVAVAVAQQMSTWIFYLVLLILIFLMHLEGFRKNPEAQLFLKIFYTAVAGFLVCTGLSWAVGGMNFQSRIFQRFWTFVRDGNMDSLRIYYIQWFFTAICITYVTIQYSIHWYRNRVEYQSLHIRMESAVKFAEKANQYMEEVREVKHDMNRHLSVLHLYLTDGRYTDAEEYLKGLEVQLTEAATKIYCRHLLINYLVGKYAEQAKTHDILFVCNIHIPEKLGIEDTDLCSLLENILENAVEACLKMPSGKADIRLEITMENRVLRIHCSNTYAGELKEQYGKYETTKKDVTVHGYGIQIIRKVCENYGGGLSVRTENGRFYLRAAVPEKFCMQEY